MSPLFFLLLTACTAGAVRTPGTGDTHVDTSDTNASDTNATDTAHTTTLEAPAEVRLPYVEVGAATPSATVTVSAPSGTTSALSFAVTGPFAATGDKSPMRPDETRDFAVTLTGGTHAIRLVDGAITFTADGQSARVRLSAVVARPGLPGAAWTPEGHVLVTTVPMPTAPYPDGDSTWTDPSVLIAVPEGMRADIRPGVVMHFHGFNSQLSTTVPAQYLVQQFDLSGRDAVFIVPQGPVVAASGDFGKLMDPGGYKALVDDVLSVAWRDGLLHSPVPDQQVLSSHSGGYAALDAVLAGGGYPISGIHLFDSVYDDWADFADFAAGGGVLRSVYTSGGGTISGNNALTDLLDDAGVAWTDDFHDDTLQGSTVTVGSSPYDHNGCVWGTRLYARWLAESGLPNHAQTPPDLLSTLAGGGDARVTWRVDRGSVGRVVRVQGSVDGAAWTDLGEGSSGALTVPARPWLRTVGVAADGTTSRPSDVYGATGGDWLVVDGFDRVFGGSYSEETHDFAAAVAQALGASFSIAHHEAVAEGLVHLTDYDRVLWLLGDQSVMDVTFDDREQAAITAYLDGGGELIVSGSEVGFATPAAWLASALHVTFVADDAGTTHANGYTFGVAYPEDYPDVLSGDTTLWSYDTGGAAAVGWEHRVIVVGFPLETLAPGDLGPAVADLVGWLQ